MSDHTFLSQFWEGFNITKINTIDNLTLITLEPDGDGACPYGLHSHHIHDTQWRTIKDVSLLGSQVELHVKTRRICCPTCGVRSEAISRITNRRKAYVESLLPLMPVKHISQLTGLHWHTIKNIDKERLAKVVPPVEWSSLRKPVMDEFAIFKGHRYATVITGADTYQVLWVGMGRSRQNIHPFFEQLGEHCKNIEAVAMDMNTAFDLEVQHHCPNARIVYDLFHVVAKYGREVIDRVRGDQANKLKSNKKGRKWVKRSRWILLKNRSNLNVHQENHLDELLSMNKGLMVTYLLGEQLKELWYCESEEHAKALWNSWWSQVQESRIRPLMEFARKLKPYLHGITS